MGGTGEFAKANYMVGFHTSVIQTHMQTQNKH